MADVRSAYRIEGVTIVQPKHQHPYRAVAWIIILNHSRAVARALANNHSRAVARSLTLKHSRAVTAAVHV
jgi:hypothetical protein